MSHRNPKLSPREMIAMRAELPVSKSLDEDLAQLQLMGQYLDDPAARSLYEAAYQRWGVELSENG